MRNIRIKKAVKTIVLCLLYIIAFLPASVAAEESENMQVKVLEEVINQTLSSELEKNPDLKSCKITVDLDFEKDTESGKWRGDISNIIATSIDSISDEVDTAETIASDDIIENEYRDEETGYDDEYADEGSDGGNNILGWIIGSAFLIIILVAIFSRLKPKMEEMLAVSDKEKHFDDKRHHRQARKDNLLPYNTHQSIHKGDDSKLNKELQEETKTSVEQHPTVAIIVPQEATVEKTLETDIKSEPVESIPSVPITKYGKIAVLSQNELTTEDDYMSDDATGMPFVFSFSPNMQEGTYDISAPSRKSFLRDVNIIRPFVQNFDEISNPTKIVTISKGKLRRKGISWVVTEKLKIKLM